MIVVRFVRADGLHGSESTTGVNLSNVLAFEPIEMANDEWNQYLDIEKMEVVSLPDEVLGNVLQ